jgi:hypothetical protein
MGKEQGTEIKILPMMIGKALGGIAAALGVGVGVYRATHGAASGAVNAALAVAALGVAVFAVSGRLMSMRTSAAETPGRSRQSALAWLILVLLALGVALAALFLGRSG